MLGERGRIGADRDGQVVADCAAHFGALLARDHGKFGLVIGGERAREAEVGRVVARPARRAGAAAQLHRRATEPFGKRPCAGRQRFCSFAQHAAADTEAGGYERAAEQPRAHLGQRQHAGDRAARVLGDQIARALAAARLHRAAPAGAVEGRRVGVRADEGVDPQGLACVAQVRFADADGGDEERHRHACVHPGAGRGGPSAR